jgi:succinate dehydrogenase / fumarate reductase, cytochrome b subunit
VFNEKTLKLVYNLIMQHKNNPLSPHLQIYKWQISSLLSIAHRIIGVINILAITAICIWSLLLLFGVESYHSINFFLGSFFGKFIVVSLCWTFSFHILNELRHLVWDLGYGFDLKVSKITGALALVGSFIFTILFYLIGKNIF